MKKLEFYLDRYTENKKSFKSNLDQLEKFKKQVIVVQYSYFKSSLL